MSRVFGLRAALLAGAFVTAAALAGCGKQGVLEQPPPLFGAKAKAEYQARRAAAQKGSDQPQTPPASPAPAEPQASSGGASAGAGQGRSQGPGGTGSDNAPLTTRDIQDPSQKQTPASSAPIPGAPPPISGPPNTRPSF